MKWVWRGLAALVVVIVVAVAGAYLWLRTGLPPRDAVVNVSGLDGEVRVIRDGHGVPHIFAESDGDAYFALGWLHAQDRLWQMETMRRLGAGRLSEVVGERALPTDRFMRVLGVYRLAEESYDALSPELREALDRYAAGVNAWLEAREGALPPEFYLLWHAPEPWRPADSLVWGKLMALQLSSNFGDELTRARIVSAIGPERAAELFPDLDEAPYTIADGGAADALDRLAAALPPPLGPSTASNEWVVAGSRTETGAPILANDPHLGLGAPILWYLARIETPTLSLAGATAPGVPMTIVGHNDRIAWGFTTTGADVQDLFVEQVDPADPSRYLTPEGSAAFETRTETIAVRGSDPVSFDVRATRHGPVMSDVDPETEAVAGEGRVLALAFPSLTPGDTTPDAIFALNRAKDWDSFRAALGGWIAPLQNITYADVEGNIGLTTPGLVPIRAAGDGRLPVPGWNGAADWTGTIPFEAMPQVLNPAEGRIVNANNAVVGPDYPYLLAADGYEEPFRAERILEMLEADGPQTVEASAAIQADTMSLDARALLPLMLRIEPEGAVQAEALALLGAWDFRMDRARPEPLIYMGWLRDLNLAIYRDELGELTPEYFGLHVTVIRRLLEGGSAWCDNVATEAAESCTDVLRGSLTVALEELAARHGADLAAWRWGDEHRAPLANRVFARIPLLGGLVDIGIEADGGPHTVNRGGTALADPEAPFADVHGAGFRGIYDLADLSRSRFVIATGQSGNPLSPHYGDLVETWRDGRYSTLAGTPEELAARGGGTLILQPAE